MSGGGGGGGGGGGVINLPTVSVYITTFYSFASSLLLRHGYSNMFRSMEGGGGGGGGGVELELYCHGYANLFKFWGRGGNHPPPP